MLLIVGHIVLVIGLFLFAWGIKIPLPSETSWKKAALHALSPTFLGLLVIGAADTPLIGKIQNSKVGIKVTPNPGAPPTVEQHFLTSAVMPMWNLPRR